MVDLKTAARDLDKALTAVDKALSTYFDALIALGRECPDPVERGLSAKQVKTRLQTYVISRLCPKPVFGQPSPILQFDGAPEARRFVEARGALPGLS